MPVDPSGNPDLTEIREAIDVLDQRIVQLIGERRAWVRALAGSAGASPEVVGRTYRALIASFVALELRCTNDTRQML